MKLTRDVRKAGYSALMAMFCIMLFQNLTQVLNDKTIKVKEHSISSSNHLNGLMSDEEQSIPADNEEDEDDEEDEAESAAVKLYQEFTFSTSYKSHQDHLFGDPHPELASPPPKS